jgi:protein involved in polysaccharide export with SLBB domain
MTGHSRFARKIRVGMTSVVSVSLREASKREIGRISLLGAVSSPGALEIKEGTTLTEALAAAGGPAARADLRRVAITSVDGSLRAMDLSQAEMTGRAERGTILQPGDIVMVPQGAPSTVLVLGEVAKPGSYEIASQVRLLDNILRAAAVLALL